MTRTKHPRWGYKGTETALNGLQDYLDRKLGYDRGTTTARYEANCLIIIEIGLILLPDTVFKNNDTGDRARLLAKRIQNGKYLEFTELFSKMYGKSIT